MNCFQFFNERIQFNQNFINSADDIELIKPFLLPDYVCKNSFDCIKYILGADLFPVGLVDVEKYNKCIGFLQSYSNEYLEQVKSWIDVTLKKGVNDRSGSPASTFEIITKNLEDDFKKVNSCLLEIYLLQKRT